MGARLLRWSASATVAGLALLGAGCSASSSSAPVDYYVSLGDSYAAGYQPSPTGGIGTTSTNGFAYQAVRLAQAKGYHYTLANFGCGGATTTSMIGTTGCPPGALGPNGIAYPTTTQAAAAEAFLRAHRGHVGLVTVSISGNDVTHCAGATDPTACVISAIGTIKTNLATLLSGLRDAAGPGVRIVGTTYPDVLLGLWVAGTPTDHSLAKLSVTAFQSLLNPALSGAYQAVHGQFVDVTA
ncbi:MAG TPA: GDSL-type esterase/lipase family protein, partial [Acidimicrobiales bacterium]|nr:GDSL-type esterase/lipase family protein [Acidimicrobiales bacterium]